RPGPSSPTRRSSDLRGALDVRATHINEEMKKAAVRAIADLIQDDELSSDYVIPDPFNKFVAPEVAMAVAEAAMNSGVSRIKISSRTVYEKTLKLTETEIGRASCR